MVRVPKIVGWPLLAAWTYGVLYFMANRAVYHPWKHPQGNWELQSHLAAEDVLLRAADGVRLHGWWIRPPDARVATLFLHGNAGNITHRAASAAEIAAAGSAVLLLDYRGYGKSEGRPTEKGLYADAEAGYDHLLQAGFHAQQIVAHGESLGTAPAVDLAARRPVGGLVLEAGFSSARDVAGRILPFIGPLVLSGFDSRSKIAAVRAPVLMIHGDRDEVIAFDLGQKLFQAARQPKEFWQITGAMHNNLLAVAGVEYRNRLRAFYDRIAAPMKSTP